MPGENGEIGDESGKYDTGSFASKTAGKRIIVLVAGVTMNIILAMVLFMFAYGFGQPVAAPQVGSVVQVRPRSRWYAPGRYLHLGEWPECAAVSDVQDITNTLISEHSNAVPYQSQL